MQRHQEIRKVAPELFVRAMFGGFANQFGWLFFAFGMVFFWAFFTSVNFDDIFYFTGELRKTQGVVEKVEDTSAEENDVRVQRIIFSFPSPDSKPTAESAPGQKPDVIVAQCYETGTSRKQGSKVEIEYSPKNPQKARIVGTRRGIFQIWVLFLVAIFPVVGIGFIFFGVRRGLYIRRLLQNSLLTYGVLVGKEPTNTRINHQTVMKLTFSFTTQDGRAANAIARTHEYEHLVDEAEEPILYNPYAPKEACLLDDIPGRPRLDENNCLTPTENERVSRTLFMPAVALLVNVLGLLAQLYFLHN